MTAEAAPSLLTSRAARVTLMMSCMFGAAGVIMVFLPRWLEQERGLDGAEIGAVLSLAQAARVLTGPAIAFWADGVADRRWPLRVAATASVAAYAAFFLIAHDFWSLLALGFIALSLTQAIAPLGGGRRAARHRTGKDFLRRRARPRVGRLHHRQRRRRRLDRALWFGRGGGLGALCSNAHRRLCLVRAAARSAVIACQARKRRRALFRAWRFAWEPTISGADRRLRPDPKRARVLLRVLDLGLARPGHFRSQCGRALGLWRSPSKLCSCWRLAPIERRVSPEAMILAGGGRRRVALDLDGVCADRDRPMAAAGAAHGSRSPPPMSGPCGCCFARPRKHRRRWRRRSMRRCRRACSWGASTVFSGMLYDAFGARGYWAMAGLACAGGALALFLLPAAPRRPRSRLS